MNIGYIGLGLLGSALARRFLDAHALTVWDADPAAVRALEGAGAHAARSAAEVGRRSDVVLLCLPRSADVKQVLFESDGLAQALSAGKLVIDQTSGTPADTRAFARKLAAHGVGMVDAPVEDAGGVVSIIAAGPDEHWTRALPLLRAITERVHRCGARVGDGQAMKIVNDAMHGSLRLGTLEVVAMGRKMGLSIEAMTDVLNKGAGRNQTTECVLTALAHGKPSSGGAVSPMLSDLNQAVALGMQMGVPTPIVNVARGLLQIGVNTRGEGARLEQVADLVESMAATRLAQPVEKPPAPQEPAVPIRAENLKVGYVGLGAMGGALARRLMLSRELSVFDKCTEMLRDFEAEGALVAPDLAALARACDVIMLCLPTSAIVGQVLFGEGGLAEGLGPGKIIVDQTSGDPNQTRAFAARLEQIGVDLVDAPVSGGPRGAVAGTIAIMCGGTPAAFGRVHPILASISPNVVHCGQTGNGHVAKIVNNAVSSLGRLVTYEGASLGLKHGFTLEQISEAVNQGSGRSLASERILPVLASGRAASNFQLQLMVKDLRLAADLAMSCGAPMLVSQTVRGIYETGLNQLGAAANIDEMARLYEAAGKLSFTKETIE